MTLGVRLRRPGGRPRTGDPNLRALEDRLRAVLGTKVRILPARAGGGTLEISFFSDEDLTRLVDVIGGSP